MAADEADLQPLFTLSRVAASRQQFEAAVTATAQSDPAANISQGDLLICFDEGGATREALPPLDCPLEGTRHITPSPLSKRAESREPQRHTGSTQSAPVPDLTGQSESPQLLRDALRLIETLTGVVQNTLLRPSTAARPSVKVDLPTYSGYHDTVSANDYLDRMLTYQQATGLSDGEMLERVVPVSLTGGSDLPATGQAR